VSDDCLPKTQLFANTISGSMSSDPCPMVVSEILRCKSRI